MAKQKEFEGKELAANFEKLVPKKTEKEVQPIASIIPTNFNQDIVHTIRWDANDLKNFFDCLYTIQKDDPTINQKEVMSMAVKDLIKSTKKKFGTITPHTKYPQKLKEALNL